MIRRDKYLKELWPYVNKPIIKVITGIRRAGKSELLKMIREELLKQEVEDNQIVYINFESFQWNAYKNAESLFSPK